MNGIKIELSIFARIVYPGAITWTFLYWRYGDSLCITQFNAFFIPLSLIIGVVLYAFYRAVVLPAILCIEDKCKWIGVPQYGFYRSIVDDIIDKIEPNEKKKEELAKKLKKMKWAAACAAKVLTLHAPPEFKDALYKFNSFVHVMFITSFVAFAALIHDLMTGDFEFWWIWLLVISVSFFAGIAFDCLQSNPREAAFLIQHRQIYKTFIRELANYYKGLEKAKRKNAKRYSS